MHAGDTLLAELAAALVELRRELRRGVRAADTATKPSLLPVAQVEVLQAITDFLGTGSRPRVHDVAMALSVADNTISGQIAELTRRGLVARTTDPADARVARLSVTAAGRRQLQRWTQAHIAVLSAGLNTLSREQRAGILDATNVMATLAHTLRVLPRPGTDERR